MKLPRFLTPDTEPELRPNPDDPQQREALRYIQSFLWMRVAVGVAGVLLPLVLPIVDRWGFHGVPHLRDSMSAYYWSGMHDVFVTVIFGTGAFLVLYKCVEVNLDNTASIVAGIGATCLAWFPTSPGKGCDSPPITAATCTHRPLPVLTPLQNLSSPTRIQHVHWVGTGAFVVFLAVISCLFGIREGKRERVPGKLPPGFWRWYHIGWAGVMALGLAWILVSSLWKLGPDWRVFAGEVTCVFAFGASWLLKGWEWDTLRGRPIAARRRPPSGD